MLSRSVWPLTIWMLPVSTLTLSMLTVSTLTAPALAADSPPPLVEEARKRVRMRDVRGALGTLEKAIAADPANADAHILYQDVGKEALGTEALLTTYRQKASEKAGDPLYAYLYARLLKPEDALAAFEKQISSHPQSPWPHAGRARALEALGRASEAAEEYDAAVSAAPRESRFKSWQAFGLERTGNWAAAAEAWRLVLASAPNDRAARMGLGEALRKVHLYDEAITVFTDVLNADASDAEARYRIGLANADAGRIDDALKAFDEALAGDKMFVEAMCAAAEASVKKAIDAAEKEDRDPTEKDLDRAIAYGKRATAVAPDKADAHFTLGAAHEAAGETNLIHYDSALVEYDVALSLMAIPGPEKLRALCAKAFVLLRLQRWDQALTTADRALGIDDKCTAAYLHAGFALAAQGNQDDAIKKYYRPGLKISPDDPRLRHALGVALWESRHEQDAKKELEAAVKNDPNNDRFRLSLGELYFTLKDFRKAGEQLVKVVDNRPNDPATWGVYGRICCALKDWTQAVEAYEKVCQLLDKPAAPPADVPPGATAPPPPVVAAGEDSIDEHLYLAIIYNDHLKKRDKAKEHIKKFVEMGGTDTNLQAWIDGLLADK